MKGDRHGDHAGGVAARGRRRCELAAAVGIPDEELEPGVRREAPEAVGDLRRRGSVELRSVRVQSDHGHSAARSCVAGHERVAVRAVDRHDLPAGRGARGEKPQHVVGGPHGPALLRGADHVVRLRPAVVLAEVGVPLRGRVVAKPGREEVEPGVLEGVDVRLRERRPVLPGARIDRPAGIPDPARGVLGDVQGLPLRRGQRVPDLPDLGQPAHQLGRVPVVPVDVHRPGVEEVGHVRREEGEPLVLGLPERAHGSDEVTAHEADLRADAEALQVGVEQPVELLVLLHRDPAGVDLVLDRHPAQARDAFRSHEVGERVREREHAPGGIGCSAAPGDVDRCARALRKLRRADERLPQIRICVRVGEEEEADEVGVERDDLGFHVLHVLLGDADVAADRRVDVLVELRAESREVGDEDRRRSQLERGDLDARLGLVVRDPRLVRRHARDRGEDGIRALGGERDRKGDDLHRAGGHGHGARRERGRPDRHRQRCRRREVTVQLRDPCLNREGRVPKCLRRRDELDGEVREEQDLHLAAHDLLLDRLSGQDDDSDLQAVVLLELLEPDHRSSARRAHVRVGPGTALSRHLDHDPLQHRRHAAGRDARDHGHRQIGVVLPLQGAELEQERARRRRAGVRRSGRGRHPRQRECERCSEPDPERQPLRPNRPQRTQSCP